VEIGNEDWFDRSGSYDGRFTQMARAIRKRYPQIKIIATAPVTSFKPDMYDDHYYRSARQMLQMSTLYDMPTGAPNKLTFAGGGWGGRQPDGVKTFVGEWAAQEGRPTPNLGSALGDAAFVMGLESNSDAVLMECYAPLFVNVSPADPAKGYPKAMQWNTNLIGYDALHSFGSASYYAQVMLAQNKGDSVLPAKLTVESSGASQADSRNIFATATFDRAASSVLVKVVNAGDAAADISIQLEGAKVEPNGTATVLAGEPAWVNTIEEPQKVAPQQQPIANLASTFHRTFPPHSFSILRIKTAKP
jgi:alpha-N-arabinofuranosidase